MPLKKATVVKKAATKKAAVAKAAEAKASKGVADGANETRRGRPGRPRGPGRPPAEDASAGQPAGKRGLKVRTGLHAVRLSAKVGKINTKLLRPGKVDRQEVKQATEMTKEEWSGHQVGMLEKWPLPTYMEGKNGHMQFKEDTFYIVTRWTAATRIAYRPHAKSPGSKSHLRYERYSRAKTVGEALALSAYPVDWCWDFERGFIKVLGGPVHDEPLDLTKVDDEKDITDVDRALHTWYVRELAKKIGIKQSEIAKSVPHGESLLMRCQRMLAQKEAKERLEAADQAGRMISDDDVLQTLKRWPFFRNPWRRNVMSEGETWVFSDTLGLLRDRQGDLHLTAPTRRYPQVTELFTRWLTDRLPEDCKSFAFTSLNVNCNYAAQQHRDQGNFGPSFIKAFGQFTGGLLNYWPDDSPGTELPGSKPGASMDLSKELVLFNGNSSHSVTDFQGSRYSIVYFTVGCHAMAAAEDLKRMEQLGIPMPPATADPFTLLREPLGHGATPHKGALPAFRRYEVAKLKPCRTPAEVRKRAKAVAANRLEPDHSKSFYSAEQRRMRKYGTTEGKDDDPAEMEY